MGVNKSNSHLQYKFQMSVNNILQIRNIKKYAPGNYYSYNMFNFPFLAFKMTPASDVFQVGITLIINTMKPVLCGKSRQIVCFVPQKIVLCQQ